LKKLEEKQESASPRVDSMMRIDPDKPGLLELLRGEGEPAMRVLAWAGIFVLLPLFIAGALTALSG
jgi:hypothetical protein